MDITHYLPERARNSFVFWNLSGTLKYSRIKSTHLCNKNLFYLEFEIFLQFFIHSEYSVICISELNITLQNPVLDRHCFFEYISNNKKSMNKIRIDLRKEDIITSFFYVTLSKEALPFSTLYWDVFAVIGNRLTISFGIIPRVSGIIGVLVGDGNYSFQRGEGAYMSWYTWKYYEFMLIIHGQFGLMSIFVATFENKPRAGAGGE